MTVTAPTRETLLQIAQQLPASPQVLVQLSDLLTDVNSGLDDVARLLRRDTALATRVIRISNSVAYGMGGRVGSVEDAVNRVGYAEIYRLVGLANAAALADQHLHSYGFSGTQLRDNTLVSALAAEMLATLTGADTRIVYTVGLLRSAGKLVLDRYAKRGARIEPFILSGGLDLLRWERTHLGVTNLEVADTVLSAWRFPAAIVQPVRHHVVTTGASPDHVQATQLLHVANAIARDAGFGLQGEQSYWDISPARLESVGLTPAAIQECTESTLTAFDALKGSL